MDSGARRELQILTTLAEGSPVTQRGLARRLGAALGLTNLYLKRLARKGYIKLSTIPPNRMIYLVTPRGLARKSRLTYEYMRYSLRLYREVREVLRHQLGHLSGSGSRRIALYGTGEAAELAYLTLKELEIEPASVLDGERGSRFLGQPVRHVGEISGDDYDVIVVATLDSSDAILATLEKRGVPAKKLILLRASSGPAVEDRVEE